MPVPYAEPCCSKLSRSLPVAAMTLIAYIMDSGRWLPTRNRSRNRHNPTLRCPTPALSNTSSLRSSRKVLHSFRRTIRRRELHQIVPLADTTIYEMEQRGEFPRRFRLTPRCMVWDLEEVEAWVKVRKQASRPLKADVRAGPDVRQRLNRPVR